MKLTRNLEAQEDHDGADFLLKGRKDQVPDVLNTHPVWTGLATGLMLSEVSVAGLLGMSESSSYSLDACRRERGLLSLILQPQDIQTRARVLELNGRNRFHEMNSDPPKSMASPLL